MRKIIVLEFISLDGVIQAPGGEEEDQSNNFKFGGWTFPFFDEFAGEIMNKQMQGEYDLLLGRKTYEIFASYWPKHVDGWPQVNKITKFVASNSLKKSSWENTEILDGDIVSKIKKLKNDGNKDLQVYGSGNFIQTLLKNDLVDELWLKIFPLTLGNGKKLFEKGTIPAGFKLINAQVSPSGVIFANYKRSGEIKTGNIGE